MKNAGVYLEVDTDQVSSQLAALRSAMDPEKFERAMYGVFGRVGRHVSTVLRKDLPKEYQVRPREIGQAVKAPKVSAGPMGVGCSIPIRAPRKLIGGTGNFSATGYRRGWNSLKGKYRVRAKILTDRETQLPLNVPSYGGKPPFRNIPSVLGRSTFTREGKERLPIRKVTAISIPQMPMNRSQDDVQADICGYLQKQLDQRIQYYVRTGK